MPRKTVHSVIADVLRDAEGPLTIQEIYDTILDRSLYEFRAKAPYNVVRNQLQRHCVENTHSCAAKTKHFRATNDGRFANLTIPTDDGRVCG